MFIYIVALILFVILLAFPLIVANIIKWRIYYMDRFKHEEYLPQEKKDELGEEYRAFEKHYHVVYKDLRQKDVIGLHYYLIYVLRRQIFIMICFYL